jgi:hypothetical protein
MKRFSFATFQIEESNRDALETCRAIAELKPVEPLPVLLLGEKGCGKTHLLYAIVNHVRAASEVMGLACVTAREFPEKVLQIINDPTPVARARSAILLIDELESFSERLGELEAVTRIFLDNGHCVLITSSVHPARLKNVSAEFRALIEKGLIVRMAALGGAEIIPAPSGNRAMEDLVRRQHEVIQQLRDELERARDGSAVSEILTLQRQIESEQLRSAELNNRLNTEREERKALKASLEKNEAEARELRAELDAGRQTLTAVGDVKLDVEKLNMQLEELKAEREAGERERELLVAELANKSKLDDELSALRVQLKNAREDSERAQAESREFVERARVVLEHVEASKNTLAELERRQQEQLDELERRIAEGVSASGGSHLFVDDAELEKLRKDHEDEVSMLEARLAAAKAEIKSALKGRDDAFERLDQMTAVYASLEIDYDQARVDLQFAKKELDALRAEAASQVAEANAQAGDIEHEYARLLSGTDLSRRTAQEIVIELQTLRARLAEQTQSIDRLAARLIETADRAEDDLSRAPAGFSSNGDAEAECPEPDLFEGLNVANPAELEPKNGSKETTLPTDFNLESALRIDDALDLHKFPSGS